MFYVNEMNLNLTFNCNFMKAGHILDGVRVDGVDHGHVVLDDAVDRLLRVRHDDPLLQVREHSLVVADEECVRHVGQLFTGTRRVC